MRLAFETTSKVLYGNPMNILPESNSIANALQAGLSESGVSAKNPKLHNISVANLLASLTYIPEGDKDGSYFTRAGFIEGATGHSDKDMLNISSVIILDADKTEGEPKKLGAPCQYKVHENLKAAGINHLIVRSHSHQRPGYGNRYRIIIRTDRPYNNEQLPGLNIQALHLCGSPIKNVTENNTWSQPWYLPRKPKGDTNDFTYLEYTDGQPLIVPTVVTPAPAPSPPPPPDSKLRPLVDEHAPGHTPLEVSEILKRMVTCNTPDNKFGDKKIEAYISGNLEAFASDFPPNKPNDLCDRSRVDSWFSSHSYFWCGGNAVKMAAVMKATGSYRPKHDNESYMRRTINGVVDKLKACNTPVYTGPQKKIPLEKAAPVQRENVEPGLLTGFRYLAGAQQIEHFKGCVYVQDLHRVFTPRGAFLKPEQFNATYGGYVFALDDTGRKETKKAWEAFTESQVVEYKQAETTCFNPKLPTGAFTTYDDKIAVNIYVPSNTPCVVGDPTRFLNHLAKVLPDEQDRAILTSYIAACIQHKGVKFQWAPLLQGMEGNGKTLFTRCVAYAIGERFTHMPPAEQIAEKYNEWLYGTLFIGVEDIYVPDHKLNVIEVL